MSFSSPPTAFAHFRDKRKLVVYELLATYLVGASTHATGRQGAESVLCKLWTVQTAGIQSRDRMCADYMEREDHGFALSRVFCCVHALYTVCAVLSIYNPVFVCAIPGFLRKARIRGLRNKIQGWSESVYFAPNVYTLLVGLLF